MAGLGKKTFTAGEVLTAADVNGYLMEQSVMVFGGTAARSSAIPTPSEGMVTYRSDSDALEYYNGSAWTTVGAVNTDGLKLLTVNSFSAQSAVNFSSVFSSTYSRYRLLMDIKGSVSGGSTLNFRCRENTTDVTTSYYGASGIAAYGGQFQLGDAFNNATTVSLRALSTGNNNFISLDLHRTATGCFVNGTLYDYANSQAAFIAWHRDNMTNFNGFTLYPSSGTMTGTVRIYGYQESL